MPDKVPVIDSVKPPEVSKDGKFIKLYITTTDGDTITLRSHAEPIDALIVALESAARQAQKSRIAQGQTEPSTDLPVVAMVIKPDDFQVLQDQNTKKSRLCLNRKGRYQLQIILGRQAYQGLREAFQRDPTPSHRGRKH